MADSPLVDTWDEQGVPVADVEPVDAEVEHDVEHDGPADV